MARIEDSEERDDLLDWSWGWVKVKVWMRVIYLKNIGTGDLEDHVKDEFYKGNPKLKD